MARRANSDVGSLKVYDAKRDFSATPEPRAKRVRAKGNRFVVQKHAARRLHFDLRLELDGVLKSWAVTRGPSLVPGDKRLAIHTEDHPLDYLTFEGVIPAGQYGGGTMIVWDEGRWIPEGDARKDYEAGRLTFTLEGQRLKGRWHLVRTRRKPRDTKEQWLLLKSEDAFARAPAEPAIVEEETRSIRSGRTIEELAREGEVRADHAGRLRVAGTRKSTMSVESVAGARKAVLPAFVEPCLAKLADTAPSGSQWIHEIKFDGYRLQARIDGRKVCLLTRRGLDWTKRFAHVADALRALRLPSALIDGEVVVEDESGVSNFSALQQDLSAQRTDRMVFHAFDLLYCDGHDLRHAALEDRKALLQLALDDTPAGSIVRFSEHIAGSGDALVRHACRIGLEGIVSKRADQPYRSGRGEIWLKSKCTQRQEFVIAGYLLSSVSRKAVGSLILGYYEDGRLIHAGRAGTGFTAASARDLWTALSALEVAAPPFEASVPAEAQRGARWIRPELVAEVEYRGWTHDGSLRHASFKGLREDKDPREVMREAEGPSDDTPKSAVSALPSMRLTHPDRLLWEGEGLTKLGLADFYAQIADWILPHVVNRPLSLLRCPSGIAKECFFQKHAWAGMDETLVLPVHVGDDHVLTIRDVEGLLALVQAGVLEIHPWGSTLASVEKPDRVTFDLDPGDDVGWDGVVQAALEVRERLERVGLASFVKTTGGKGLHVVVPLKPKAGWELAKTFAETLARVMAKDSPGRYTASLAKRARNGRIFVDYLRNGRGATAVAAYSTRARAGAPLSTPVAWDELPDLTTSRHFRVSNLLARLHHLSRDPWADLPRAAQVLSKEVVQRL